MENSFVRQISGDDIMLYGNAIGTRTMPDVAGNSITPIAFVSVETTAVYSYEPKYCDNLPGCNYLSMP